MGNGPGRPHARSVNELATEFGCDWHTVNDAVIAYGEALLEADEDRIGEVSALGLDEVLMVRLGPYHRQHFSTQLVDVRAGPAARHRPWSGQCRTHGLAGRTRTSLPASHRVRHPRPVRPLSPRVRGDGARATLVADPFHVCKLANTKLDECRRRVQNETLGHRGRKSDPLYRCRRLFTKAKERLDDKGTEKLMGLLRAGDPTGMWPPCGRPRKPSASSTPTPIPTSPSSGSPSSATTSKTRTTRSKPAHSGAPYPLARQIAAWHQAHVTNGPTEAVNNLIKRVKRAAFGFTSFRNYRIRSLLYAGKPNWDLLATVTPR